MKHTMVEAMIETPSHFGRPVACLRGPGGLGLDEDVSHWVARSAFFGQESQLTQGGKRILQTICINSVSIILKKTFEIRECVTHENPDKWK